MFSRPWFWLGIWVFYYLSITNYTGIGLIETVLVLTFFFAEIPTGAIADLLGKKKTLILAFLLQTIGNLIMGLAENIHVLMLSVLIGALGGTFYSGTIEALAYDSLLQLKQSKRYQFTIAHMNSLRLISPAFASIIGGYLYTRNPSLPFFAAGLLYFFGFITSLFLTEPKIDSEKFSLKNFISQTRQGFHHLIITPALKRQTLLLLSIAGIVVIAEEMLDSFLSFEFGFTEIQMGILWASIFLVSAASSQLSPHLKHKIGLNYSFLFSGLIISLTFLISPYLGLILGGLTLFFRASLSAIFQNLTSDAINQTTPSKFRATTISTFNMLQNVPYMLLAASLGYLSDTYSAKIIAAFLGLTLLILITLQSFSSFTKRSTTSTI